MVQNKAVRWVLLGAAVFAAILIPFMLFEEQITAWTQRALESASSRWVVALIVGALLGGDILLPVPSSMVGTASGYFLGFARGMAAAMAGMTLSCALGFWLGAKFGRPMALRFVGEAELLRLERARQRLGDWALVVSRPVPMLAEASVLFAGISHMPWPRFLLLSTLSNLGICAVYAAVGAFSATANAFLLAFFGSILLPGLAMWLARRERPVKRETPAQQSAQTRA